MNRIDYLLNKYNAKLVKSLKKKEKFIAVTDDHIDAFFKYDPSKNKKYSQWIIEAYLNDRLLYEDLYKVADYLIYFDRYKKNMSVEHRDINQYENLTDIWLAVKPFVENSDEYKSRSQVRDEERDKAYDETFVVFKNDEISIVIPLTQYAAEFHGRGTQWCTSAKNHGMFKEYQIHAPLMIIDIKGQCKSQLNIASNMQWMDENDKKVGEEYIENNWKYFSDIAYFLTSNGRTNFLNCMPGKYLNEENVKLSIINNVFCTNWILDNKKYTKYITNELLLEVIDIEPSIIASLIKRKHPIEISQDEWGKAVSKNPSLITIVPKEYIDEKMVYGVLLRSGSYLKNLPERFLTKEICEFAAKQKEARLDIIPEKYRSKQVCLDVFQNNPISAFRYMPDKYKTLEMVKEYVKQPYASLRDMPEKMLSYDLVKELVYTEPYSNLKIISDEYMKNKIYQEFNTLEMYETGYNKDHDYRILGIMPYQVRHKITKVYKEPKKFGAEYTEDIIRHKWQKNNVDEFLKNVFDVNMDDVIKKASRFMVQPAGQKIVNDDVDKDILENLTW